MGPVSAFRSFFGRYFDVYGRSRRFEYFWMLLVQAVLFIGGTALVGMSEASVEGLGDLNFFSQVIIVFIGLWSIGTIIPWMTLNIRRYHDMGYTGWIVALFMGLWVIPPLGMIGSVIQFFWVLLGSGTAGVNEYGQDPRFSGANVFA